MLFSAIQSAKSAPRRSAPDSTIICRAAADTFESLSNSGKRKAKQVPHDFNSEKKFVKNLINFDKRIKIY